MGERYELMPLGYLAKVPFPISKQMVLVKCYEGQYFCEPLIVLPMAKCQVTMLSVGGEQE